MLGAGNKYFINIVYKQRIHIILDHLMQGTCAKVLDVYILGPVWAEQTFENVHYPQGQIYTDFPVQGVCDEIN